jgi:hypothetical protein
MGLRLSVEPLMQNMLVKLRSMKQAELLIKKLVDGVMKNEYLLQCVAKKMLWIIDIFQILIFHLFILLQRSSENEKLQNSQLIVD